ncbi:hypothetical protein [Weissella tructae]
MAITLTEAQAKKRRGYEEVTGWPDSLLKEDIVLLEMVSLKLLEKVYFNRPDFPGIPLERSFLIPKDVWKDYKTAVALGKTYKGSKHVEYGDF